MWYWYRLRNNRWQQHLPSPAIPAARKEVHPVRPAWPAGRCQRRPSLPPRERCRLPGWRRPLLSPPQGSPDTSPRLPHNRNPCPRPGPGQPAHPQWGAPGWPPLPLPLRPGLRAPHKAGTLDRVRHLYSLPAPRRRSLGTRVPHRAGTLDRVRRLYSLPAPRRPHRGSWFPHKEDNLLYGLRPRPHHRCSWSRVRPEPYRAGSPPCASHPLHRSCTPVRCCQSQGRCPVKGRAPPPRRSARSWK